MEDPAFHSCITSFHPQPSCFPFDSIWGNRKHLAARSLFGWCKKGQVSPFRLSLRRKIQHKLLRVSIQFDMLPCALEGDPSYPCGKHPRQLEWMHSEAPKTVDSSKLYLDHRPICSLHLHHKISHIASESANFAMFHDEFPLRHWAGISRIP